ncbi:hypothetical protein D3C77_546830 [compost metagenome]
MLHNDKGRLKQLGNKNQDELDDAIESMQIKLLTKKSLHNENDGDSDQKAGKKRSKSQFVFIIKYHPQKGNKQV